MKNLRVLSIGWENTQQNSRYTQSGKISGFVSQSEIYVPPFLVKYRVAGKINKGHNLERIMYAQSESKIGDSWKQSNT